MRVARALQTGRGQTPLFLFGPNNIFVRKLASNAPLATDQTPALKLANQMNYSNSNYSYDGSPAPSFYGYSGLGYGGTAWGNQTQLNYWQYTIPLYVVDSSVPTQTVTVVQSSGTPWPPGTFNNLQAGFNAVPVPDVTKIPQGQIQAIGTDGHAVIWRPSTNELWEMWRFGGSAGAYTFRYGAYTSSANTFNGIWPNNWGARATSLASLGGVVTIQDIIDVLNGLPIKHVIGVAIPVTSTTPSFFTPPATRCDDHTVTGTPQYQSDGTTPNPAYGSGDAVAEGTYFRFPSTFNPSSAMQNAGPLQLAIATAIRDYGLFVFDGASSGARLNVEDPRVLGSPYSYAKVNPFAGSTGLAANYYDTRTNQYVPTGWTQSQLSKMTEVMNGVNNMIIKIPWQQLQVLQPFSS
jgi:hypothetical protein